MLLERATKLQTLRLRCGIGMSEMVLEKLRAHGETNPHFKLELEPHGNYSAVSLAQLAYAFGGSSSVPVRSLISFNPGKELPESTDRIQFLGDKLAKPKVVEKLGHAVIKSWR